MQPTWRGMNRGWMAGGGVLLQELYSARCVLDLCPTGVKTARTEATPALRVSPAQRVSQARQVPQARRVPELPPQREPARAPDRGFGGNRRCRLRCAQARVRSRVVSESRP